MGEVLHGTWLPQRRSFWLWGETDAPTPRRGRQSRLPIHPFQCQPSPLHEYLADLPSSNAIPPELALTVWLPSVGGRPVPSPELQAMGLELPAGSVVLAPWRVTGLLLTMNQAVDLLLDAALERHAGSDMRAWRVTVLLGFELVASQQILPGLVRRGSDFQALWMARPNPETAGKIASLAKAMPPLACAVVDDPASGPTARALLNDFLATMVDSTARDLLQAEARPQVANEQRAVIGQRVTAYGPLPDSVGGSWLAGLTDLHTEGHLRGREADNLFKEWQAWASQGLAAGNEAFRITFRLEPPANADKPWALSYLLQATDDPSLLVPAGVIWRERGAAFTYLDRRFDQPQERLLRGLDYAAKFFPPINESLHTKAPEQALFTIEQAFSFLKDAAPLLEQSGFGVLVPGWWTGKGQLKARAKIGAQKKAKEGLGGMGLSDLLSYRWELSVGETPIDAAEFEQLVALKQPLIQVRGEWVALDPEQMQQALKLVKSGGKLSLAEVLRMSLSETSAALPSGVAFGGVEAAGPLGELLLGLGETQKLAELPPPATLRASLRPYQVRGFSWLAFMRRWGLGACLADDMGLGKCVLGNTMLFVNGTLSTAEQLWERHTGAPAFDGAGYWAELSDQLLINALDQSGAMTIAPIRRLYRQHVREQLRTVRLEDGSTITITQAHKLLTNKGWTNTFAVGDYVCVPARLLWEGTPADPDLVTLLAWQLAEGYEVPGRTTLTITQQDRAQLERLYTLLLRIGERYQLKLNRPVIRAYSGKAPYLTLTSKAYQQLLTDQGYVWGKRSAEKSIPDFIMQADIDSLRLFLRGFFDAEGSVISSMRSIEISSASPLLMQQLAVLLRRFGIWMRVSQKQKRATNGSGVFRTYQFGVIGGNGARRFLKEIGFGNPEKQSRLVAITVSEANANVEGIPVSNLVGAMLEATGLPVRHFGMHNTVYINGSQQFSRENLQRVITHTDAVINGDSEAFYRQQGRSKWTTQTLDAYAKLDRQQLTHTRQELQHMLEQEVFYCRIKAIEESEHNGWVYDFEVDQHHNFVANQVICHNTVQATALLLHDIEIAPTAGPALIVCPTSVVGNWRREIERFAPSLRVLTHQGPERQRGAAFVEAAQAHDVVLTSYPLLMRDQESLVDIEWRAAILDEAQNIKNSDTRQARAARALRAQSRVALTGTPVENRLTELWSIMAFLNPGYLGAESEFRQAYARPIERTGDAAATQRLRQLTTPFVLRRLKSDPLVIADLPDKIETKVYVPLTNEQATLYEATVRQAIEAIEGADEAGSAMQRRGMVLAMLVKLKQICNHPAHYLKDGSSLADRSGKLDRLEAMLEEILAEGERALIFTQFAEMGELLLTRLGDQFTEETLFLHGGTPTKEREAMVRRFQASDGPRLFILSLKAGGVGLNLTQATHVFHFDRWWNPAVENQATDRAFRIGQLRNVQVHKFVCTGTLEERIDDLIDRKRVLAENVLGAGESWLTELDTNQLRDLVALRSEEVDE